MTATGRHKLCRVNEVHSARSTRVAIVIDAVADAGWAAGVGLGGVALNVGPRRRIAF